MARARTAERGAGGVGPEGAADAAPSAHPLELVQAAVAGDDLRGVTRRAAEGCGRAVAVTLPSFGPPVHWPNSGAHAAQLAGLLEYAASLIADRAGAGLGGLPDGVSDAVPVTLGSSVVGVVAALGPGSADIALRPWLDAAAAALAVTTLMRDPGAVDLAGAQRTFLEGLELHPPRDVAGLLAEGRRLGVDLNHGAIGICALIPEDVAADSAPAGVVMAEVSAGRLLGLVPLITEGAEELADSIVASVRDAGACAARSAPRRVPEMLQEALVEAAVLAELGPIAGAGADVAREETYRLLVSVLLRSPDELTRLRARTVAELERYDSLHDTELLGTLQAFLGHHGSTTETADAMSLHRHTVGYRLARVQEVAGLSPYESDGRERLSLGLKADAILSAERQRLLRARPT
jgi:hypothetical protein